MMKRVAGRAAVVPIQTCLDVATASHVVTIRVALTSEDVNESLSDTVHIGYVAAIAPTSIP